MYTTRHEMLQGRYPFSPSVMQRDIKFSVGKARQLKTLEEQEGKGDDSKEGADGKAGRA